MNSLHYFAELQVIESRPRMEHGTDNHAKNKEGKLLYDVDVHEEKINERYPSIKESNVKKYKSLISIEKGRKIVSLNVFTSADTKFNGAMKIVNTFYTITGLLDGAKPLKAFLQ